VTELERDFTFSLTKDPSLIFVFLVVIASHVVVETKLDSVKKNLIIILSWMKAIARSKKTIIYH